MGAVTGDMLVARIADLHFETVTRATAPFLVPLVVVLGLITVFPSLVLFVPRLVLGPPSEAATVGRPSACGPRLEAERQGCVARVDGLREAVE
jgi:hypothetical protein